MTSLNHTLLLLSLVCLAFGNLACPNNVVSADAGNGDGDGAPVDGGVGEPDSGAPGSLDGGMTGDGDAGTQGAQDGGASGGEVGRIRCVSPQQGEMLVVTPGSPLTVVAAIGDPSTVASGLVSGSPVMPDALGLMEADVTVRFGVNHLTVNIERVSGERQEQVCSFIVSERYADPDAIVQHTLSLRLGANAIDDGDLDSTSLASLADVARAALSSDAFATQLLLSLDTASDDDIKPLVCDSDLNGFCDVRSQLDYAGIDMGAWDAVNLSATTDRLDFSAQTTSLTLSANVAGEQSVDVMLPLVFGASGPVVLGDVDITGHFEVLVTDAGELRLLPSVDAVSVGSASASFVLPSAYRGDVQSGCEQFLVGASGASFRTKFADATMVALGTVLDDLLERVQVRTVEQTLSLSRWDGTSADVAFESAFSRLQASPDAVLFALGTRFAATSDAGAWPTLGVPFTEAEGEVSSTSMPAGVRVSEVALNQQLHAFWQSDGIGGVASVAMLDFPATIVGPDATIDTDMLVSPEELDVMAALPVVVVAVDNNELDVMLGGITLFLTGAGPYAEGITLQLGATVRATLAGSNTGAILSFGDAVVTELLWSSAQDFTPQARAQVEAFLVAAAYTLAMFSVDAARLTLPLPSLETSAVSETFGVAAGRTLQMLSPEISLGAGQAEVAGAFGEP